MRRVTVALACTASFAQGRQDSASNSFRSADVDPQTHSANLHQSQQAEAVEAARTPKTRRSLAVLLTAGGPLDAFGYAFGRRSPSRRLRRLRDSGGLPKGVLRPFDRRMHRLLMSVAAPERPPSRVTSEETQKPHVDEASEIEKMDAQAMDLNKAGFKPTRGADGRLHPVLTLPGDTLETNHVMKGVTVLGSLTTLAVIVRAFILSGRPIFPLLAMVLGFVMGELFSGAFHWATDNYGSLKTPVVGFACAAFQGHHLAPWTISHRSFWNNVYKIAASTIPLNMLGLLAFPPSGAAFWAVMLYCQLLAQDFHRWTHTQPKLLKPWQRKLQELGIALPFKEHIAHHKPPFDKHYCILTGGLNKLLDEKLLFWRRLEALVYRLNGQEPLSWKDPKVKQLALSTLPRKR